jgi:fructokinase
LAGAGINTEGLRYDDHARTTLAFVSLDATGNRAFSFFRNPGADFMLEKADVDSAIIRSGRLFHFGSLSLTNEPARSATVYALEAAKKAGCHISFDPNYRPLLWESPQRAKEQIMAQLHHADILKISDEEFVLITGHHDYERGTYELAQKYEISYIFVTLGPDGAAYRHGDLFRVMPTYDVRVLDTTGSGDAFTGAVLNELSLLGTEEFHRMNEEKLRGIVDFANACGALAATKKGGIPSMPDMADVAHCRSHTALLAATRDKILN